MTLERIDGCGEDVPAPRLRVAVVEGGGGAHETVYGRRTLCRGDVLLLRPGGWQAFVSRGDLRLLRLEVPADHQAADDGRRRLLFAARACDGPAAFWVAGPTLERLGDEDDPLAALAAGVASELAAAVRETPHAAVVAGAAALEADPARGWTAAALAGAAELDPAYLSRLFRRHAGRPPMAYLNRRRAESAAAWLLRTDAPIRDVAAAVGWPAGNTFARCFRRHFGISARDFRALRRPDGLPVAAPAADA